MQSNDDVTEMTDEQMWSNIASDQSYIQKQCLADSERWFGEDVAHNLEHITLGIAGEAGEVCEQLKKMIRGTKDPEDPREWAKYCEELVDVFIYLCNAAELLGFNLVEGYAEKREINERRFGEGSNHQSALATEVRRQQQVSFGPTAFVPESAIQSEVPGDREG